ncbi:MAG: hypothetical protein B7733_02325 [Myxococcales bacterium FL481]|nr:MAG: hypothetical protein B7733_02325 [Myxococcales bacterium FL481]
MATRVLLLSVLAIAASGVAGYRLGRPSQSSSTRRAAVAGSRAPKAVKTSPSLVSTGPTKRSTRVIPFPTATQHNGDGEVQRMIAEALEEQERRLSRHISDELATLAFREEEPSRVPTEQRERYVAHVDELVDQAIAQGSWTGADVREFDRLGGYLSQGELHAAYRKLSVAINAQELEVDPHALFGAPPSE